MSDVTKTPHVIIACDCCFEYTFLCLLVLSLSPELIHQCVKFPGRSPIPGAIASETHLTQ